MVRQIEQIEREQPVLPKVPEEQNGFDKANPPETSQISQKRREVAIDLWGNPEYRKRVVDAKRQTRADPAFRQKMREIARGRPSPMEGKKHAQSTKKKIRQSVENAWNLRNGIPEDATPSMKKFELLKDWMELSEDSRTTKEIERLRKEGKARFSPTMYKKYCGDGSFTRAKENLNKLEAMQISNLYAAERLTDWLTNRAGELTKYGVSEERIQKLNAQIEQARSNVLSATSEEEINQGMEKLQLCLRRIQREISITTPLSFDCFANGSKERIIFDARK